MTAHAPIGKANNGKPRPHLLAFLLSLFFLFLSFISPVNAQDVNLTDLPANLANALGIPTFAGQLLFSGCIMLMFILPFTLLTRSKGRNSIFPEIAITLVIMGCCIAIGWLPYWFLIILSVLIALSFAGAMQRWITGRGQ